MPEDARLASMERRMADLERIQAVHEERRIHIDRRFDSLEKVLSDQSATLERKIDAINTGLSRIGWVVILVVLGAVLRLVVNNGTLPGG